MILPGATLGMLGGGQLGRMFTVAARTMGYHVIVLDPDPDSPAGRIADEHLHAAYTDEWSLQQLARSCEVITAEFENVPATTLRTLEEHCAVRPSAQALYHTQDRIREKRFITHAGLPTVPFSVIESQDDLSAASEQRLAPFILKRAALGYDGKGQVHCDSLAAAKAGFSALGGLPCVLEERIDLALEISVVVARSSAGESACFPIAENQHQEGILFMSLVPARVEQALADRAMEVAVRLADALDYCGVMAVEFFISQSGELLVNEIAPRPHNSGHYTLDACVTSQFEQQVRMICDLPPGDSRLLSPVVMVNILGDLWRGGEPPWSQLLRHPNAKLHLYGKREARPGRKMGHFCYLDEDLASAQQTARSIIGELGFKVTPGK